MYVLILLITYYLNSLPKYKHVNFTFTSLIRFVSLENCAFVNVYTVQIMWPTEIHLSTRYVDLIQKQRIKIREFFKVLLLFHVCNTEYKK